MASQHQTLLEKDLRYSSHVNFLENCLKKDLIPKGFMLKWRLNVNTDKDLTEKCEKVKRDASLKLMTLAKEAYTRKLAEIQDELKRNFSEWTSQEKVGDYNCSEYNEKRSEFRRKKNKKLRNLVTTNGQSRHNPILSNDIYSKFDIYEVKRDGNCFYRCLSKHLFDTEERHFEIRENIVKYIKLNKSQYEHYIDGNFEKHVQNQSHTDGRTSSWGTEAEILAAANLFNIQIIVYSIHAGNKMEQMFKPESKTNLNTNIMHLI